MDPLTLLAGPLIAQTNLGSPGMSETSTAASEGEFLQGSQPVQQLTLMRTTYRGDCPGESVTPIRGMSFLASLPPAGNQRIVIRNRRTGGYTNREYGSGRRRSRVGGGFSFSTLREVGGRRSKNEYGELRDDDGCTLLLVRVAHKCDCDRHVEC